MPAGPVTTIWVSWEADERAGITTSRGVGAPTAPVSERRRVPIARAKRSADFDSCASSCRRSHIGMRTRAQTITRIA